MTHLRRIAPVFLLVVALAAVGTEIAYAETHRRAVPMRSGRQPAQEEKAEENGGYPKFTFDLGASAGVAGGTSFLEIYGGVNLFFLQWLYWRNSPFYRLQSGNVPDAFGLDSSMNVIVPLGDLPLVFNGGAGYRFSSRGLHAPLMEAALTGHFGSVNLRVGVKYVFNSLIRSGAANEVLFSGGVSAGTRF